MVLFVILRIVHKIINSLYCKFNRHLFEKKGKKNDKFSYSGSKQNCKTNRSFLTLGPRNLCVALSPPSAFERSSGVQPARRRVAEGGLQHAAALAEPSRCSTCTPSTPRRPDHLGGYTARLRLESGDCETVPNPPVLCSSSARAPRHGPTDRPAGVWKEQNPIWISSPARRPGRACARQTRVTDAGAGRGVGVNAVKIDRD